MFGRISRAEALWELLMLADDLKALYVHKEVMSDVQFQDTLRRLVKITDRIGGARGMNFVFGGEVGRVYSQNPIVRWFQKMVDLYYSDELEDELDEAEEDGNT